MGRYVEAVNAVSLRGLRDCRGGRSNLIDRDKIARLPLVARNDINDFFSSLVLVFSLIVLIVGQASAASQYNAYGLPGEARGMRFKVFAYNDERASQVLTMAEDTYQKLLLSLDQAGMLFKDCLIFFWKNEEDFFRESKKLSKGTPSEWAAAFADYNFSRGNVAVFAYESKDIFSNILPHEITHQVLAQGLCFTGTTFIPLWLNEGLAQYMEEDKRGRQVLISEAVKEKKHFDLKDLTSAYAYPQENVSLFYAQCLSLVEFLLENYPGDKFYSLVRRLVKDKAPIEKGLKGAYWSELESLADLEKKWLAWLKEKYYYRSLNGMESAEISDKGNGPLTQGQREIIEKVKKEVKTADKGYIWRSPHFSVRMEYLSRKELGIKDSKDLQDIYGAVIFILEEAYTKIGNEIDYRPAGKREVYLYAPKEYAVTKGSRSFIEMIEANSDKIIMEVKKSDEIREDLADYLYYYYAHIALLNRGGTKSYLKYREALAIEWKKKGEKSSAWSK